LVIDRKHFVKSGEKVDEFFHRVIALNPILAERMRQAERLREFRIDGNYSYCMESFVGDGWMMVGDAAFFVDPIFSSGVGDALHCARSAAEAINGALAADDVNASLFRTYETRIRDGADVWQGLVRLCYEAGPSFSRLIAESDYRVQAIRLCEGEVYSTQAGKTLALLRNAYEIDRDGLLERSSDRYALAK
jgi:FADH2 O2-dependent halogenase